MTPNRWSSIRYEGPPMINTSAFKQAFLKGEKDALYYCDPNAPKTSSYQTAMMGLQIDGEDVYAKILDNGHVSCAGNTMPDPATMTHNNKKFLKFEEDRMNMSRRLFQSTGQGMSTLQPLSPMSHKKQEKLGMGMTGYSNW